MPVKTRMTLEEQKVLATHVPQVNQRVTTIETSED